MPTYLYNCPTHKEFEESHSIKIKLDICPKCQEENIVPPCKVERLINSTTKGVVDLTGHELEAKTKDDIAQLKKDMKNEKVYANLMGEQQYEAMQKRIDKNKREKY